MERDDYSCGLPYNQLCTDYAQEEVSRFCCAAAVADECLTVRNCNFFALGCATPQKGPLVDMFLSLAAAN
ncbi:hypothetical protein TgHK011_005530 [Trichoderma gracile]|nr:hypothetical protein TgHK011_005530 [Trichoderma gracile]